MTNRVSVVIPAYKSAGTICRAVDSVLAQTLPAAEIIVIDDGSPDNQCVVIEQAYGDRVILIRQANGRTASARNTGIERATGDFIAFLDADDYWETAKLAKQLAVFDKHPDVVMVAGRFWEQQPKGERVPSDFHHNVRLDWDQPIPAEGAEIFRLAALTWTGTVMIRRSAVDAERFVTGLEPAEDRDFWTRIAQKGGVYFHSEPLATYVQEPGSISRSSIARDCQNMLAVIARHEPLLGRQAAREWKSHVSFRWASNDPEPASALPQLMKSFWLWPRPFKACTSVRFGRLRRLATLLLASVGLRRLQGRASHV